MALSRLKLTVQLRSAFKNSLPLSTLPKSYSSNKPPVYLPLSIPTNTSLPAGAFGPCINSARHFCTKEEKPLLSVCPTEFVDVLKKHNISRCYFVWDESQKKVVGSHPELKEIEDWLNDENNSLYRQHEAVFLAVGMRSNCLMGAFLWNVNRGQACGGIRMTSFKSVEHFLGEGLRLSQRLGVKSALAGLWIGGGKGLIFEPKDRQHIQPEFRQKIFYDYGDFVSSLNGCFIAGMDTGVNTFDLYNVHTHTRWVVSGPEDVGGSGNAAALVAKGLLCSMEAAMDYLGVGNLSGMRVAIQGAGGIVSLMALSLRINSVFSIKNARGRLKVEKVPIGDKSIIGYDCDILAPCAVGHVLTPDTILDIKAKIVCGSANALLENEDDAKLLTERDVTYVLEFIPNRMAFVNAANENYGRVYRDPELEKHFSKDWEHSIYCLTQHTLKMASEENITVVEASYRLAEEFMKRPHPLWPNRTRTIIQSLVEGGWHQGQDFWRKRRNFAKADCS
ncbi:hypothetical protein JTE90_029640 [Oedothorax gibbosus]|uniref:Glutamate/phenylalanine/leucine/valine/L-tryptophan dehydrogenase C-terminal domain-containing protein n=1 Tax=Oedothorax gibbosus TaxID=931172 RepID=A0AAV6VH68_9ARAC|nr:hypothetical protein JTE90_029640 [Oedothorax gibbosus]